MEEKEIIKQMEEKRKLPDEIKNKMMNEISNCVISSILVYVYFIFLKLGMKNIHKDIYITDLRVFGVSFAILSVIFFENSYNHKSVKKLCAGIEILILAIITMILQYFVLYLTPKYSIIVPIFAIIYNVYFVLKALVMVQKTKKDYKKDLSDIKEIVKNKEKNQ